jgi:DNA modification methylase
LRNRLHSLCPYFAMFPEEFVRKYLDAYTKPGDAVFDPFSGRGTTILQSLLMNRRAAAADINPVAYCVSSAKADPPRLDSVLREISSLEMRYKRMSPSMIEFQRRNLPPFFRRAFFHSTLRELLYLRQILEWRTNSVHRFIAALALGTLHGEMGKPMVYFSNQMPRTISTKPEYSLKYWRRHDMWPRKVDVFETLRNRARYRLAGELPKMRGWVAMVDARQCAGAFPKLKGAVRAVITSPPYCNVTNAEEDQWLRLWLLGYRARPTYGSISRDDRYKKLGRYWHFLGEVWTGVAPLLRRGSILVCRLGAKGVSTGTLTSGIIESVLKVFPKAKVIQQPAVSRIHGRQTDYFRPGSKGCLFEIDFVFEI